MFLVQNMQRNRCRGWCGTLNNYTESDYDGIKQFMEGCCTYGVIGKEKGESGTPHLQIHAEFKSEKSLNVLKKVHTKVHWEMRKGSIDQASDYCKKDGDFIEIGTRGNQGKRNDIENVREMVKNGCTMREICDNATSYQSIRTAELMRKYYAKGRTWKPKVYWYYGESGSGKTMAAMNESNEYDRWVSMDSLKWWDGYDGQSDIVIDDFRGSDCRLKTLLRILDRYEYRIENKGGSTQLLAKNIWITCPYRPEDVYRTEGEDMKQLIRRIDVIKEFNVMIFDDELDWDDDGGDMMFNCHGYFDDDLE